MYPNDLGMKAFTTIGAPCLETLSLVDKVQYAIFSPVSLSLKQMNDSPRHHTFADSLVIGT